MNYYISFDVGGTNLKYALMNDVGDFIDKAERPTDITQKGMFECIKSIVSDYQTDYEIKGLAFSMPGVIDPHRGHMITGGALYELYDFGFKDALEAEIKLPVELDNDVNCVALAEKWLGHAQECEDFVCLTVGTGVGGAIYTNNKLVRGGSFGAGEVGFMISDRRDNVEKATLSMTGSIQGGVVQSYSERTNQNWKELDGKQIFDLAEQGDEQAQTTLEAFYESLAYSLYNISVALNPEKILLGGAITQRLGFIEEVTNRTLQLKNKIRDLKNLSFPIIQACQFLNDSGKIGALYHFQQMQQQRNTL